MKEALITQPETENILDTYPVADFNLTQGEDIDSSTGEILYGPWTKINLANGKYLSSRQELISLTNSLV